MIRSLVAGLCYGGLSKATNHFTNRYYYVQQLYKICLAQSGKT